ncbi:MAG: DUF998 domain-containing protein [Methanomassiliicoccales archaeon]
MPIKKLLLRIGAFCGLIGALVFSIMWISAAYVDSNWVLGEQTLSELGGDRPGRDLFNSGVIIEALLSILFVFALRISFENDKLGKLGTDVFFFAAISLLGVGIFPITTGIYHTIASYGFFGLALLALAILIKPLHKSAIFGRLYSMLTLIAITISLVFVFLTSIPLAEAVAVICLLVWSSAVSIKMVTVKLT